MWYNFNSQRRSSRQQVFRQLTHGFQTSSEVSQPEKSLRDPGYVRVMRFIAYSKGRIWRQQIRSPLSTAAAAAAAAAALGHSVLILLY